jgi:hypothetical protein
MKSPRLTLGELLNSPSQYVIPVFQRYYRWELSQWEALWITFVEYSRPEKTQRHFMGFLVLAPEPPQPNRNTVYHLIDGQQRLTTLSLVLCALRDIAKEENLSDLAAEIEVHYLVHQFRKGAQERYRLNPKQRDRLDYLACIDGATPSSGRIGTALRFFKERISTLPDGKTEAKLKELMGLVTGQLEFVHATLEAGRFGSPLTRGAS